MLDLLREALAGLRDPVTILELVAIPAAIIGMLVVITVALGG
jgi:hypothetical protein